MVAWMIDKFGTEEQRSTFVPGLAAMDVCMRVCVCACVCVCVCVFVYVFVLNHQSFYCADAGECGVGSC